jgi:hypothetical protein
VPPCRRVEPTCYPVPLLDAAMILPQMMIYGAVRPVSHLVPEDVPDRTRVGVVAIGGDPVRRHPGHGPRRAKAGLGRGEVACVTEPYADQRAIAVHGAVERAPAGGMKKQGKCLAVNGWSEATGEAQH